MIAEYNGIMEKGIFSFFEKEDIKEKYTNASELKGDLLKAFNHLKDIEGLNIELRGIWLWVDGKTKENLNTIKSFKLENGNKFRYKKSTSEWYFNPDMNYRKMSRKKFTKNDVKSMFGVEKIKASPALAM